MKNLIYECSIETDMDLVAKIVVAAGDIQEIPTVFLNARQSPLRYHALQLTEDIWSNFFEHLHKLDLCY